MEELKYGIKRILPNTSFAQAVDKVRAGLAKQGFGVLTEIDIQATMKAKIGVDMEPYVILGACNPKLAHQALTMEPDIGLLLPCNVVVMQRGDEVIVEAVDPRAMFQVVENSAMDPVVNGVRQQFTTMLEQL